METCIKLLGADYELANAIEEDGEAGYSAWEAATRLLDEIEGYPKSTYYGGTAIEWGRRFLSGNGGSAYIDSDHLEINLPEHTRASDHALHVHAGYRIAQRARDAAQDNDRDGRRFNVLTAVSDRNRSWGNHLNVMIRRRTWDDLYTRKPHLAGFLATHLVTAMLYTGQGQVGAGNERSDCDFQISQRADWFEEMVGVQTTHRRPILNLRDEAHAGKELARMHIIFFDNAMSPIANYLKAGTCQLVLAMCEAGWADPTLLLDDPLRATWQLTRDLTLKQNLRLAGRGRQASAVEVQQRLCDLAGEFVASGEAESCVPGAADIVACWAETLDRLRRRDLSALAGRCDWALKYLLLERQRGRSGMSWRSPEMKVLDLRVSSLDPQEGLFLQMARAGVVENMPSDEQIDSAADEPPEDSRAYLRAHVLRRMGNQVVSMDWDRIRFRVQSDRYWSSEAWLGLPDPANYGKQVTDPLLEKCQTVQELVEAVGTPSDWYGSYSSSNWYREPWGRTSWTSSYPATSYPSSYYPPSRGW
jgi:hypothetical protein